jgi:hypothetical protein
MPDPTSAPIASMAKIFCVFRLLHDVSPAATDDPALRAFINFIQSSPAT